MFEEIISKVSQKEIWCGDFNANNSLGRSDHSEVMLEDFLYAFSMVKEQD